MSILLQRRGILTKQTVTGGGGGSKTPDQVTGLWSWWKADAGTSSTVDGTALSQWDDSSGNGRHLVQATSARQPVYKAAIVNSKPVVRFASASSNWMSVTATPPGQANPSDLSLFAIFKATTNTINHGLISTRDGTSGWLFRASTTGGLFGHIGGSPNATDTFTTTNWNIIELVRTGLTPVMGHNGTMTVAAAISAYPAASGAVCVGGEDNVDLGGMIPVANFVDGDIAEIAIFSAAVSDADRDALEAGWASKFGITVA